MNKEELEKEAREYLAEHSEYSEVFGQTFVAVDTLTAMVDFAEPREKRISELERNVAYYAERAKHAELAGRDYVLKYKDLGKRCLQLQKDKGDLTDRVRELEAQIEQLTFLHNEDVNTIKLLNEQIKEIKENDI